MTEDRLDRTVEAYSRILARGALRPEHDALVSRIIRLYDNDDREGARALLEQHGLMLGQPLRRRGA